MNTQTQFDNAIGYLLKEARVRFDSGGERSEALSDALKAQDAFLTREVLLHLAFLGLGTLFDTETKSRSLEAAHEFHAGPSGGAAVLPPSNGFSKALSAAFENAIAMYAQKKVIFGCKLIDTSDETMAMAISKARREQGGWTITVESYVAARPFYNGKAFRDLTQAAQGKIVQVLSDADIARKAAGIVD